jgi:signal transduction histidine kinase/AmiR/NasT family two-component response regulator
MKSNRSVAITTTDHTTTRRRFWFLYPFIYVAVTVVITGIAGAFAYLGSYNSQTANFEKDYSTLSHAAVVLLQKSLERRFESAKAIASVFANVFWNADSWPYVYLYGYDEIVHNIQPSAVINSSPLVRPDQVKSFEQFAYSCYARSYPNRSVAQSDFGEGIFALGNQSTCFTCDRYHDTTGAVNYDSPYEILVPILQGNVSSTAMMFTLHSDPTRGKAIDKVITCSEERRSPNINCGAITVPTHALTTGEVTSVYYNPVYPALNATVLTSVTAVTFPWEQVLEDLFELNVSGVQCVLQAANVKYTFIITEGQAVVEATEDTHSTQYDRYAVSISVTAAGQVLSAVHPYTLTVYPTDALVQQYRTNKPVIVCAVVVGGILLLAAALATGTYFLWLRRSNLEGRALAHAKRQFVRYISHEIRTPLNTVSLGLTLLLSELRGTAPLDSEPGNTEDEVKSTLELNTPPPSTVVGGEDVVWSRKCREWERLVNELIENSQCAVLLLDDLLCFEQLECSDGKIDTSAPPPGISVLPAWELLSKCLADFEVRVRLSGVTLERDCEFEDSTLPPARMLALETLRVLGNETQLQRVVNSLLGNALHFSQEGSTILVTAGWIDDSQRQGQRTSTIEQLRSAAQASFGTNVSWLTGGRVGLSRAGLLRVTITDEAGGLTAEQTAQVFGKGSRFRFGQLQAGQGSGIGLFVCRAIAEHHHARIRVVSEGLGHGSTYILEMPAFTTAVANLMPPTVSGGGEAEIGEGLDEGGASAPTQVELRSRSRDGNVEGAAETDGSGEHWTKEAEEAKTPVLDPLDLQPQHREQRANSTASVVRILNSPVEAAGYRTRGLKGSAPTQQRERSRSHSASFTNKRILVVDDAPSNRKMLVRVLARSGHVCDQAQDGQVAVDMVRRMREGGWGEGGAGQYDMVLMDYEMPVTNGPTATRALRELGCMCPIVGVTGNVLGADIDYFLEQGADAVLPKPLQPSALAEVWQGFVSVCRSRTNSRG